MKCHRSLATALLLSALPLGAFAQSAEAADASIPFVYSVENTGAQYPAPLFPDFDWLPIVRPLTDPFRFADGSRDTSLANWERRRNEIKASIEKYEIGQKPSSLDLTVAATYTPPPAGGNAGRLIVVVTRNSNGKTLTLNSKVYVPQGWGEGPFPGLIPMTAGTGTSTSGPNYGSLAAVLTSRPVATVDFVHDQVTTYGGNANKSPNPFYVMYPELNPPGGAAASNSGQYAAWAWGVSRIIDGIQIASKQAVNPMPVDPQFLAVTGCSYAGKMALFAGAFDERVALTIPLESGGGGAPAWRVSQEIEGDRVVEALTHTDKQWFASQLFQFSRDNVYKLPYDHHELMAMVAPRALIETGNTSFNWLSNKANYVSARATQQIYETLGIGERFGFVVDGGHNHCAVPASQVPVLANFVDKFLLGITSADTNVHTHPFGDSFDYQRWTAWWGSQNPVFPNDWNPGNGTIVASMIRPLNVALGATVTAGYSVAMLFEHPPSTVSLAGGRVQLDIVATDGRSRTLTVSLPNQAYAIPAGDSSWFPSPSEKSSLTLQGSAIADFGGAATRAFFSAVGVNDGGAGNPAGPGLVSDTRGPVDVRFHTDADSQGAGGSWSEKMTVTVTPLLVTQDGFTLNRRTNSITQQVTLTNVTSAIVTGPIYLALAGLSTNTSLLNASGKGSSSGLPYLLVSNTGLAPGDSLRASLQFAVPATGAISYTPQTMQNGTAP
jgi:hypothetical protein